MTNAADLGSDPLLSLRSRRRRRGTRADPGSVFSARFQRRDHVPPRPPCQRAMWSGKMAARWRGEDVDFNADDGDLLAGDAPIEVPVPSL